MRALFSFRSWDASTRALLADSRESFGRIRAVLRLLLNEGHPRVWRLRLLVKTGLRCLSLAKRRKEVVTSFSSLLPMRVRRICSVGASLRVARWLVWSELYQFPNVHQFFFHIHTWA